MHKAANAHIVLNSRDRILPGSSGVYNNLNLTNPGQNIVQGQLHDVAVSEILFPYDIPNVQAGYNFFTISNGVEFAPTITITPGFYCGTELVTAINAAIAAAATAGGVPVNDMPSFSYDPISNRFTINTPEVTVPYDAWEIFSPYTFPSIATPITETLGKDLLSIMGFVRGPAPTVMFGNPNFPAVTGGSAPLVFTQYIDICSPKLCQYQYIRDGSTTSLPRRVDLIARLYVEDETSMPYMFDASGNPMPVGCRPFVIHRQFKNQRIMRNTAANAVNDIDIQLYDDCGQPLTTTWEPRPYQITFHVFEPGDREQRENVGYRY